MQPSNTEQRRLMLTEPIGRLLFKKALPTVIIQLITVIYNTADTYFVAKVGTSASAAVGVVFSLMAIIQAIGFGIGMGANSLISPSLGAKREQDANVYGSTAVLMGLVMGLLLSVFGLIFLHPLLRLIGASETVLPYAAQYAKYILLAAPFMCVAFVLNSILRAEGQALYSMIGMSTGGILNLILDPIFIFVLHRGIAGAAIATMIGQLAGFVILATFFLRDRSIVKLRLRFLSKKPVTYWRILRTGAPTFLRQGLASLSSTLLNVQAKAFGDAAVAAISIANKLYMLVRNVVIGVGHGFQPIAGYCFGAKRYSRVKKVFWRATSAASLICIAIAIPVYFFRAPIMAWFRDDPAVIAIGSDMLRFLCLSIPLMAYSTFVNQLYQSLGFSAGASFLASCRQGLFFLPLVFILPAAFGVTGIESVQAAADILTFFISIPFHIFFFKKHLSEPDIVD